MLRADPDPGGIQVRINDSIIVLSSNSMGIVDLGRILLLIDSYNVIVTVERLVINVIVLRLIVLVDMIFC